jgi:hypothetical protein
MKWPGMGDPYKRSKTIKFLIMTAIIGISVAAISTVAQSALNPNDPLKVCINDKITPYKIKITLDLIVDGEKADIPANIGISESCKKTMYTLTDDGTIYVEWEKEFPFEIGHFLWMWDFPLRDMEQSKSSLSVNGKISEKFINHQLRDGDHFTAEFVSKSYDESKDRDFLPEK